MKCEDCKGSGRYTGFRTVEECRACGGSGIGTVQPLVVDPSGSFRGVYTQESDASRLTVTVRMDGTVKLRIDEAFLCDVVRFSSAEKLACALRCLQDHGGPSYENESALAFDPVNGTLRITWGGADSVETEADIPKILAFLEECASR